MAEAKRDGNYVTTLLGITDDGNQTPTNLIVDPTTKRLKVSATLSAALADLSDVTITSVQDGDVLTYDSGSGDWINQTPAGGGDFSGPASSTDNAVVRFDGTGGKTGQNSVVIIDDSGNVTGLGTLNTLNLPSSDFSGVSDTETLTNKTIDADNNTISNLAIGAEVSATISNDVNVAASTAFLIGSTTQIATGNTHEFQVLGAAPNNDGITIGKWGANANESHIDFVKSRNATIGSNTIVQDNDAIGGLRFFPDDGVDFATEAAAFHAEVDDASPAAGDIGMAFVWQQMPGGGGAIAETMRLSAAGYLGIGESAPSAKLHVQGDGATSSTFAMLVEDSANSEIITVRDDGVIAFGTDATIGNAKYQFAAPDNSTAVGFTDASGNFRHTFLANSSNAYAAWRSSNNYDLHFGVNSTDRIAIDYNAGDPIVGVGTTSPDRMLHVEHDTSATNTVTDVLRLTSTSTGTPAAGIGVGMEFEVETAAGNNEVGAVIEAVTTDVTATAEDFDLVFSTMEAGAAATEGMRILSDGTVRFAETAYFDAEVDNGNSGTSDNIDWTVGNKQKSTLTGNVTFTFTEPNGPCNLILKLVQDGTGSRTVTWPADVLWPGGTAPTLTTTASAVDIVSFYYDGTDFYGQAGLDFS